MADACRFLHEPKDVSTNHNVNMSALHDLEAAIGDLQEGVGVRVDTIAAEMCEQRELMINFLNVFNSQVELILISNNHQPIEVNGISVPKVSRRMPVAQRTSLAKKMRTDSGQRGVVIDIAKLTNAKIVSE